MMIERAGDSISVGQFVDLVGAPLPEHTQDIEQYIQSSFRTLAGQFAEQVTGVDGVPQLDDFKIGIGEIAGRYGLSLPDEPEQIIPFLTQLGQYWVPDLFPLDAPGGPVFDPTITKTDPDSTSYPINVPGNSASPIPIVPGVVAGGGTPSPNPPEPVKSIRVCSNGRATTKIEIWRGYFLVDIAPSSTQHDKNTKFPLTYEGPCYNYGKSCSHIKAYGTMGESWTFHVEVNP
jgi:hypothetical protein